MLGGSGTSAGPGATQSLNERLGCSAGAGHPCAQRERYILPCSPDDLANQQACEHAERMGRFTPIKISP